MAATEKARANRLRRTAHRRGLQLTKSGRRDPRALDYGVYWVSDAATGALLSARVGMTLDDVERLLEGWQPDAAARATCITCKRPL